MSVENTETFGNYLIHGIDEIMLPETIPWWPSAPGWKVLGLILLAWLLLRAIRLTRRWWRNRYRREALRQLQQLQQQAGSKALDVVAYLPYYIKVTALQAYPRTEVASLSGENWLAFLDAHYSGPPFAEGTGRKLLAVSYLPRQQWQLDDNESGRLIQMVQQWIAKHREASHV
jgi:hypothetical protein